MDKLFDNWLWQNKKIFLIWICLFGIGAIICVGYALLSIFWSADWWIDLAKVLLFIAPLRHVTRSRYKHLRKNFNALKK